MNQEDGTIYQFQNEEALRAQEEMLEDRAKKLNKPFTGLAIINNMPNPNCEVCGGTGSKKSKVGFGFIPCVCTMNKTEET